MLAFRPLFSRPHSLRSTAIFRDVVAVTLYERFCSFYNHEFQKAFVITPSALT
jgi:hypothetical protein